MSAYVNGALAAFDRVLKSIRILNPNQESEALNLLETQVLLYIDMYKQIDTFRESHKVKDDLWEKIKKTCETEEDIENLEQIRKIFEA